MYRARNRDRAKEVGVALAAAANDWDAHATVEEADSLYEGNGIGVGAAWTKKGVLFVVARGAAASRLDALLRDEDIATPQGRVPASPAVSSHESEET